MNGSSERIGTASPVIETSGLVKRFADANAVAGNGDPALVGRRRRDHLRLGILFLVIADRRFRSMDVVE